jgi:hypothetical protein
LEQCILNLEFFYYGNVNKQKQAFGRITTVTSKSLLSLFKVTCRIVKCIKPQTSGESLVLPVVIDMVEIVLGESCAD